MKRFVFMLFLFAVSAGACAQSNACRDANTQSQMDVCAGQRLKAADVALAKFYASYMKRLDSNQVKLFKSANAAWVKYRKAYCAFQASGVQGGSVYPMIVADCMATQATRRLHNLRVTLVLHCRHEGYLGCPAWSSSVPNKSLQPTVIPLRGLPAAELRR